MRRMRVWPGNRWPLQPHRFCRRVEEVGGLGTGLSQILYSRDPSYSAGIQLNLPLRNRIAQADYERDEMMIRQSQVRVQELENQIRLEVEGGVIRWNRRVRHMRRRWRAERFRKNP